MAGETAQEKRFRRHANHHFASNGRPLPLDFFPQPTPTRLSREGFDLIAKRYYRRDFSGVLELRYLLGGKKGTYYDWIMNTERFARMNKELQALQKRLSSEARRLRKIMKAMRKQVRAKSAASGEFLSQLMAAAEPLRRDLADFKARYQGVLGIMDEVHAQGLYYRTRSFCFDACTTTRELTLFTEFITAYMQVFGDLRISGSRRLLTAGEVREAIIAYYVFYAAIKKIRALWTDGMSFEDIQEKFSTLGEQEIENITLESGDRGWDFEAGDLALGLASQHTNTTVGNLRQVRHADKAYARAVKEQVASIQEIEKVLNHSTRVPPLWPFGPKRQQEEQANQIIRTVLRLPLPE